MQRLWFTRVLHYACLSFIPLLINDTIKSGFIYNLKTYIQTMIFTQAVSKTITEGKLTMRFHLESNTGYYNCYQNTQQENYVYYTKGDKVAKTVSLHQPEKEV